MLGPILDKARHQFTGGLVLPGHKLHGEAARIIDAPLPRSVVIPLSQHIGAPAKPTVAVGNTVKRGQIIGEAVGYVSAPVHATTSGTVTAIEPRPVPHPSGLPAPCIVIEADGKDTPAKDVLPACEDYTTVDRSELRARVRAAGIVGLGGATFPTSVKLNPGGEAMVDTLILNGAECEPYISCDAALMSEHAEEVIRGAELIRHILGARDVLIGIEDNIPHVAGALVDAITELGLKTMAVRVAPTRYPQGGEKQLIESLTGRQVPSQGLPLDIGLVVHNVGTAYAAWRAIRHGEPLISRVVTVTGGAIAKPHNVRARIGTPIQDLLDLCGAPQAPDGLIMGGPMMGFTLPSAQCPMVKGTNCVLAQTAAELRPPDAAMPCIRCGECMDACPARLLPQQLYWHARAREFDKAQALNLFDCIECGVCAQVCPSHIPLVQYYRYAKTEIFTAEAEKRKSDHARNRHEFRIERLEREKHEKEEARRRKREALRQQPAEPVVAPAPKPSAGNDAIAAAIAKAKAEKARRLAEQGAPDDAAPTGDAIADAIAKAKAAKAARQAGDASTSTRPQRGSKPARDDDAIAAAIAKAKAAKAARQAGESSTATSPAAPDTPADDPVAAAIAKAKAAKAARQSGESPSATPPAASDSPADDPVAAAIAKAKAAKAARQSGESTSATPPTASDSPADDPVAAAIARAKAAKAARAARDTDS